MAKKNSGFKPEISQEDRVKALKQTFIFEAVAVFIALFFLLMNVEAFMHEHPKATITDGLMGAMEELSKNPTYMFPIDYSPIMPLSVATLAALLMFVSYSFNKLKVHGNVNTLKGRTQWAKPRELCEKYAEFIETRVGPAFLKSVKFLDSFLVRKDFKSAYGNMIMSEKLFISTNMKIAKQAINTLILGASGKGKTRFWLKPNLLQMNCSFAITDPKGEVLDSCGELLRRNGYDVKVFDIAQLITATPDSRMVGNSYNPLRYCHSEADVKKVVKALITNTSETKGGNKSDPFWDNSMETMMCAYVGFLTQVPEGEDRPYSMIPEVTGGVCYKPCFPVVTELLRMTNAKWTPNCGITLAEGVQLADGKNNTAGASQIAALFENLRAYEMKRQDCGPDDLVKPYCLKEWENIANTPEKTMTTIVTTATVRLDPFNIEQVKDLTMSDNINLEEIPTKKTAVFLIMPADIKTYNFLLSMLYTQLFDILYRFGEKKVEGSKILKLPNRELVRWFSRDEVGTADAEVAKIKAAHYEKVEVGGIKKGVDKTGKKHTKIHFDDSYYDIKTEDGEIISRRLTEKDAKQYIADLQKAKLERGNVPELPFHFRFLIDEFPNIGEIPEFKEKLATMRGYEISSVVICQSITQLKGMYPDDYEVIDMNCPFTVFLGGDENTTAEYLSKKIGSSTTRGMNQSVDSKKVSASYNTEEQKLMNPEDIGRIDFLHQMVFVAGENPLYDGKYDLLKHKQYKNTKEYLGRCGIEAMIFDKEEHFEPLFGGSYLFRDMSAMAIPDVRPFNIEEFKNVLGVDSLKEGIEKEKTLIKRYALEEASSAMAF